MPVFAVKETKLDTLPANHFVDPFQGLIVRLLDTAGVARVEEIVTTEKNWKQYPSADSDGDMVRYLRVELYSECTMSQEAFDDVLTDYVDADKHKSVFVATDDEAVDYAMAACG